MDDSEHGPGQPRRGPSARTEAEQRRARQAAALRENLRRRKAQERGRDTPPDPGSGTSGPIREDP